MIDPSAVVAEEVRQAAKVENGPEARQLTQQELAQMAAEGAKLDKAIHGTGNLDEQQVVNFTKMLLDQLTHDNRMQVLDKILGEDSDHKAMYAAVRGKLSKSADSYADYKKEIVGAVAQNILADPKKLEAATDLVSNLEKLDASKVVKTGKVKQMVDKFLGSSKNASQILGQMALVWMIDEIAGTSLSKSLMTANALSMIAGVDRKQTLLTTTGLGALQNVLGAQRSA